jgi:hypothetical protein
MFKPYWFGKEMSTLSGEPILTLDILSEISFYTVAFLQNYRFTRIKSIFIIFPTSKKISFPINSSLNYLVEKSL